MPFHIFILVMAILTLFLMLGRRQFDELLRHLHTHHKEQWLNAGQPIGYFWQPEESVAWVKGTQARGRLFWSWMRATPEWMDDQLPWKLRIVRLTTVFSSLGFVLAGIGLMSGQGG